MLEALGIEKGYEVRTGSLHFLWYSGGWGMVWDKPAL